MTAAAETIVYLIQIRVVGDVAFTDAGVTVLDVREPVEWQHGHVDGAVNIPVQVLAERAHELPDKDATYGAVMDAMDDLRQAQIEDIGLITERKLRRHGALRARVPLLREADPPAFHS